MRGPAYLAPVLFPREQYGAYTHREAGQAIAIEGIMAVIAPQLLAALCWGLRVPASERGAV